MKQPIYIAGVAMTPFGRYDGWMQDLAQRAVADALVDANVEQGDVQAYYTANVFGGMVLGQVLLRDMGATGPAVYNVENACASGATGVHLAIHALEAGRYDTVVVLGSEQLTALGGGALPLQRNDYMTELYVRAGLTLPAIYAMRATRYLHEFGVKPEVLAEVAVKNRRHGKLNPYAQTKTETTVDEVMSSRMVFDPLTLLQCCPSAVDDAAALVLTIKRPMKRTRPVRVLASVVQSGRQESGTENILAAEITARAARLAYREAGVTPSDLSMVELHDAFTIAELIYYNALGLCARGEAHDLLRSGATRLGGRVPVNPSGGLLAKGHPLGATGVAQMVEAAWQLEGRAGDRQIKNATLALTQCTGGGIAGVDHAASAVHILGH
ncbi:3-ketoacyl-CoA thiolase [Candidatus Burkholderia verschuerenii]|uniref:propanoyl-CoA C-acyltransferase n=1 Tax=Candidatus Burkholderia verschuerenii TaxID=242163 RepID=A0A0L0MBG3_9BURK|nr:thiolase family protein [Candidatus Burkholderia verschuerenii]KND59601.1 3-ketoacyl-CoA thiolase [Candidatus Burkholderia verschuerenii]